MRRAAGEVETPGSRAKAGPIRAFLAMLAFFVPPLLPAAAGAQEAADPVTGFALSRGKDMNRAHARRVRVLTISWSRNVTKLLPAQSSLRKSPVAAALLGWLAASVFAESPAAGQDALQGIAGNPGAVDVEPGTGELGRLIGFGPDSGVRLGGVLVSNGNYLASGGNSPGVASFNNLLVTGLNADLDKLVNFPGAMIGAALLRFDGQPTNQQAGLLTGYNSLPGAPPLDRTEFYELWWRQSLFADTVVVRFWKAGSN